MSARAGTVEDDLKSRITVADVNKRSEGVAVTENPAPAKRQKLAATAASTRSKECPPHPGYMGGICIRCGALKQDLDDIATVTYDNDTTISNPKTNSLALKYIHHGLEVTRDEAHRLQLESINRNLNARRLLLILDLDHTLLHSSRVSDLTAQQVEVLHAKETEEGNNDGNKMLYHIAYMSMWTKLRPGIRTFLKKAREIFDLHVFTMGDKDYAAGIAAILDPDGTLFGGRVASSSDAGPTGFKDIDVLLGSEELVLILDDTIGVWPRHRDNVIQIERGHSLFELGTDEQPDTGALSTSLRVLTQVHDRFFAEYDGKKLEKNDVNNMKNGDGDSSNAIVLPDVRNHLRTIRAEILTGCCILFSRIIPRGIPDPSKHHFWQLATELGAVCLMNECDEVTHVVAADVTEKTKWAKSAGKWVVSTEWLLRSAFSWKKADEQQFKLVPSTNLSNVMHLKDQVASYNEASDVAAALAAAGGGVVEGNKQQQQQ